MEEKGNINKETYNKYINSISNLRFNQSLVFTVARVKEVKNDSKKLKDVEFDTIHIQLSNMGEFVSFLDKVIDLREVQRLLQLGELQSDTLVELPASSIIKQTMLTLVEKVFVDRSKDIVVT